MPVHGGMSSGTDRTNWPELCSAMIEMSSWRVVYVKEDKVEKKNCSKKRFKACRFGTTHSAHCHCRHTLVYHQAPSLL